MHSSPDQFRCQSSMALGFPARSRTSHPLLKVLVTVGPHCLSGAHQQTASAFQMQSTRLVCPSLSFPVFLATYYPPCSLWVADGNGQELKAVCGRFVLVKRMNRRWSQRCPSREWVPN